MTQKTKRIIGIILITIIIGLTIYGLYTGNTALPILIILGIRIGIIFIPYKSIHTILKLT